MKAESTTELVASPSPWTCKPGVSGDYWEVDGAPELYNASTENAQYNEPFPQPVCMVYSHQGAGEANARLIAAAPAMLALLHSVYHALKSYQYGNDSPDLAEEVSGMVYNIIARAEGRA